MHHIGAAREVDQRTMRCFVCTARFGMISVIGSTAAVCWGKVKSRVRASLSREF